MLKMELLTSLPQNNELNQMDLMSENKQHELESVNLDYDAFTSMEKIEPQSSKNGDQDQEETLQKFHWNYIASRNFGIGFLGKFLCLFLEVRKISSLLKG